MLSVTNKPIILSVVMLSVIMLNVIMLSVVAPFDQLLGNSAPPSVQTEQSKYKFKNKKLIIELNTRKIITKT
jgi:hypothetical protein